MKKCGVLLINLGTPHAAKPHAVYGFLTQFLNDPHVIDLPFFLRWPLVNFIIIPWRFLKTTRAYKKIWSTAGSPLLLFSKDLQKALSTHLGENYQVELAMRYGNPSIATALQRLASCQRLIIMPLFPQYSVSANGSAITKVKHLLAKKTAAPAIFIQQDFYNHPGFIAAYSEKIAAYLTNAACDFILFSYHGLPERHLRDRACKAPCDLLQSCPPVTADNLLCYRAHCYATTQLIAEKLKLPKTQYQVAFQSRLGRTPWIQPFTDKVLRELRTRGIKNLAIVCPSFVADCLETLEEINLRARAQWQSLGGEAFTFIPCLNADAAWVKTLADIVVLRETLG